LARKSVQRDAILRIMKNTTSHPGADWVYEQVRKEMPNISMGTVYRNLHLLARSGEISQIDDISGQSRFDGNIENHYHFRCEKCGRLFDLDEPVDRSIEDRVARKTGFKINKHHLELIGLCPDCQ
jgi:Fur family peroxide stress response transcriptional regulator